MKTSSLPSSPAVSAAFSPKTVKLAAPRLTPVTVRTSFDSSGIPRSAPSLIVRLLVGLAKVTFSKVGISDSDSSVRVPSPLSFSLASSSKSLVAIIRSATTVLSVIGSRPS
ncbi:hypothetical protein D9M72_564680 [compost metagenome]